MCARARVCVCACKDVSAHPVAEFLDGAGEDDVVAHALGSQLLQRLPVHIRLCVLHRISEVVACHAQCVVLCV